MDEIISRRKFLKLGIFGVAGLSPLLNSCATALIETKEDVANIKWDANPVIPVPTYGCYIGRHSDLIQGFLGAYYSKVKKVGKESVDKSFERSLEWYGRLPAVRSFYDRHVRDNWFPLEVCRAIDEHGIIPLIRYYFSPFFEKVAKGEYDSQLIQFAKNSREFGKPFFFVPYPEANTRWYKSVHPWAKQSPKYFRQAWRHMHNIMEDNGANEYAVWGLHLQASNAGGEGKSSTFLLDEGLFDWIGFTCYNSIRSWGRNRSLSEIIGADYRWASRTFPTKPFALWEFGTSTNSNQGKWLKRAYRDIKNRPRIKLVVYSEYPVLGSKGDMSMIGIDSRSYYREAISDSYFISAKI